MKRNRQGNNTNNDSWGWECWGCIHAENESLQGYADNQYNFKIAVPAASGNYFGLSRPWEGTMFQIFEVYSNTQYTVKFKFGWMHYPNSSLEDKTINVVIKDASDNKNLNKMLLSEDNYYAAILVMVLSMDYFLIVGMMWNLPLPLKNQLLMQDFKFGIPTQHLYIL